MNEKDYETYRQVDNEIREIEEKVNLRYNTKMTLIIVIISLILVLVLYIYIHNQFDNMDEHLRMVYDVALNCSR